MGMDKHPSYYYTREEWSRLGMMGPLPDERNKLLQRELAEMKIKQVTTEGRVNLGKTHGFCWIATDAGGNKGFLCHRRKQKDGEFGITGRERPPGEYYFVKQDGGDETTYDTEEAAKKAGVSWDT